MPSRAAREPFLLYSDFRPTSCASLSKIAKCAAVHVDNARAVGENRFARIFQHFIGGRFGRQRFRSLRLVSCD